LERYSHHWVKQASGGIAFDETATISGVRQSVPAIGQQPPRAAGKEYAAAHGASLVAFEQDAEAEEQEAVG
jgi:hypothetical protein